MLSKLMIELYCVVFNLDTTDTHVVSVCKKYGFVVKKIEYIEKQHTVVCVVCTKTINIVIFKGTDDLQDVISDISFFPKNTKMGVVHGGFYKTFLEVYDQLIEKINTFEKIVITGHSLGAALGTLCAVYFKHKNPVLITFGSPKVGTKSFVDSTCGLVHIRWVNKYDIIGRIPLMFKHFGEKRTVAFGNVFTKNHTAQKYRNSVCVKQLQYYESEIIQNNY